MKPLNPTRKDLSAYRWVRVEGMNTLALAMVGEVDGVAMFHGAIAWITVELDDWFRWSALPGEPEQGISPTVEKAKRAVERAARRGKA